MPQRMESSQSKRTGTNVLQDAKKCDLLALEEPFSRSSFSFNTAGGERVGFSVENEGSVYYLINHKDEDRGGVRCVRDIN